MQNGRLRVVGNAGGSETRPYKPSSSATSMAGIGRPIVAIRRQFLIANARLKFGVIPSATVLEIF